MTFRSGTNYGYEGWAHTESSIGHVPVWLQLNSGEVVVHGADTLVNVTPNAGEANVTWTSDITGTANISGGVWMTRDINRNMDWFLYVGNELISSGNIFYNDAYNRVNAHSFSDGLTGDNILSFDVDEGDVVKLELVKGANSSYSDFVGVDLTIEVATAVPEAPSLAIFALGFMILGGRRLKYK